MITQYSSWHDLTPDRGVFSGGAKAHTEELDGETLQSVVRSLRTTDCKISGCNTSTRAFAPPEEKPRTGTIASSRIVMHRHASSCTIMQHHASSYTIIHHHVSCMLTILRHHWCCDKIREKSKTDPRCFRCFIRSLLPVRNAF